MYFFGATFLLYDTYVLIIVMIILSSKSKKGYNKLK